MPYIKTFHTKWILIWSHQSVAMVITHPPKTVRKCCLLARRHFSSQLPQFLSVPTDHNFLNQVFMTSSLVHSIRLLVPFVPISRRVNIECLNCFTLAGEQSHRCTGEKWFLLFSSQNNHSQAKRTVGTNQELECSSVTETWKITQGLKCGGFKILVKRAVPGAGFFLKFHLLGSNQATISQLAVNYQLFLSEAWRSRISYSLCIILTGY